MFLLNNSVHYHIKTGLSLWPSYVSSKQFSPLYQTSRSLLASYVSSLTLNNSAHYIKQVDHYDHHMFLLNNSAHCIKRSRSLWPSYVSSKWFSPLYQTSLSLWLPSVSSLILNNSAHYIKQVDHYDHHMFLLNNSVHYIKTGLSLWP